MSAHVFDEGFDRLFPNGGVVDGDVVRHQLGEGRTLFILVVMSQHHLADADNALDVPEVRSIAIGFPNKQVGSHNYCWNMMSRTINSPRHEALRRLLKERRQRAEMTQQQVAAKIGRHQSFVSAVEKGQHRVSVVEFLDLADAIGFDPRAAIRRVAAAKSSK